MLRRQGPREEIEEIDMGAAVTDVFILGGREVVCGLIVADYVRPP